MFKKPSKMSSEEIWNYILRGQYISNYDSPQDVEEAVSRLKIQHEGKELAKAQLLQQTGEYAGIFVALLIFGGVIFLLMKPVYPISLLKAVCVSFLTYTLSKIAIIPFIRFWRSEDDGEI